MTIPTKLKARSHSLRVTILPTQTTVSNTGLFATSSDYTQTVGKTVVNGVLTATGGAIVDIQGGALSGTGTINGDVLMKGIMSPGSGGAPGTFTINGNYEQTSSGVFDEIIKGASSNGVLDVTGVLALDPGSLLEITLQGGFDPVGDSFTILDYGSLAGEFSNGSTFFADGFEWTLSYTPDNHPELLQLYDAIQVAQQQNHAQVTAQIPADLADRFLDLWLKR